MSWNFRITSPERELLCDEIQKEKYCPPDLRDLLCAQVRVMDLTSPYPEKKLAISVASDGHHDSNYCYGNFKVEKTWVV